MAETEILHLRDEIRKRAEQQLLLEQIITNLTSLLEGSSEAMCVFDKDGFLLHSNAASRRMLGISPTPDSKLFSRPNIFDFYTPWAKDRVLKECVHHHLKPNTKWTGVVEMRNKSGNYEFTALQSVETIPSEHVPDQIFYKTYFSIHLESSSSSGAPGSALTASTPSTSLKEQERISTYTDLVKHLPVGVGIWRFEGEARGCAIRLVCANALASQYVVGSSASLLPGSVIHEVLPNGLEVHRFLQEVIHTKRIATIDQFQPGPGRAPFAVTAIPLASSYVAVVMEAPRSSPSSPSSPTITSSPSSSGEMVIKGLGELDSVPLAMATCAGQEMVLCNSAFSSMLGLSSAALAGRNIVSILEMRLRAQTTTSASRTSIDTLRNALLHHSNSIVPAKAPTPCQIEVELERHAWLICVHPLPASHPPQSIILAHRLRELVQIPSPHSVFHMFPSSNNSLSGKEDPKPDQHTITLPPSGAMPPSRSSSSSSLSSSASLVHHPRAKRPHSETVDDEAESASMESDFKHRRPFTVLPPLAPSHDVIESQILKHSSAATACIDGRGNFVMANKAFAQLLGYSSDSNILNSSFLDLVHAEDEDQARNVWRQLSKHELQTFDVALRFVQAGGQKPTTAIVASFIALPPSTTANPSAPSWTSGSVVVLQLHHAGRLRHFPEVFLADKEMLKSVFREVIVGTAVIDPLKLTATSHHQSHRLHMANPSFCAILGAPEADLAGRPLLDMIHPENREKVAKLLKDVSAGHTMHHQLSIRTLPKSGPPRWAALSASAVLDSHANPFLLLAQLQLVDKPFY